MQDDLFGASLPAPSHATPPSPSTRPRSPRGVQAARPDPALQALAQRMPALLRMGVSTWSYPGWKDLVWQGDYDARVLSRQGLQALSQHPLMRTVCIDRSFWRPLSVEQYAQMAVQVPPDFRFVVKCPNVITDALVRGEDGKGQQPNPVFLDPGLAVQQWVRPAVQGLGPTLGVLVYQLSPLPWDKLRHPKTVFQPLAALLAATREALTELGAQQVLVAVEVRDPLLLEDGLIHTLQARGATLCLGLHGKMPPIEQQLPILRKLWPTPLVCRWNLNTAFGAFGYPEAQAKHQPFDALRTPDPHTRAILARTIAGITGAGQAAFVTISNDAEGCAPLSIAQLAADIGACRSAAAAHSGPSPT